MLKLCLFNYDLYKYLIVIVMIYLFMDIHLGFNSNPSPRREKPMILGRKFFLNLVIVNLFIEA